MEEFKLNHASREGDDNKQHSFLQQEELPPPPSLPLYRLFSRIPGPRNFGVRIFIISFVGTQLPLIALLVYVLLNVELTNEILTTISIALIAILLGTASTVIALVAYTEPVAAISRALENFSSLRSMPNLPAQYDDDIGQLMANTQGALSKLHTLMRDIHELSISDELTGLYNRRFFMEQAKQMLARAKRYKEPLTLIYVDIDHFKEVNDRFSHHVGDETLKAIASLMSRNARRSDLVARIGGEEFVMIFPQTKLEQAMVMCERLRNSVERYDWFPIHPDLKVTISLGGAQLDGDESIKQLMDRADQKLYEAKDSGRNRVVL